MSNKTEATWHPGDGPAPGKLDAETLARWFEIAHDNHPETHREFAEECLASPEFAAHNAAVWEEGVIQATAAHRMGRQHIANPYVGQQPDAEDTGYVEYVSDAEATRNEEPCCAAHVEPEPIWYDGACCENCPALRGEPR